MNNRHHPLSASPRSIFRQGGLSLIELLVAMTISLVLLGGVMKIFSSNKQSYRVQENLGRIQENGRFAVDLIARTLRMTGWQGDDPGDWVLGGLSTTNGGVSALSGTNDDTGTGNTILDGTDTITVIYQGNTDGLVKDCQGNTVPVGTNVENTFRVNITAGGVVGATAGTVGQLECVTNPGSTIALIDGVESFQIQYGIDTDSDQTANSYVTIDKVTDTDDVVSVRIFMLLMSNKDFLAVTPRTYSETLLDYTYTAASSDRRLRRRISTTINMRNRL